MKVGVIGLGTMGMGAALNLVRKGHTVTGCETREAGRAEFVAAGGAAVASLPRIHIRAAPVGCLTASTAASSADIPSSVDISVIELGELKRCRGAPLARRSYRSRRAGGPTSACSGSRSTPFHHRETYECILDRRRAWASRARFRRFARCRRVSRRRSARQRRFFASAPGPSARHIQVLFHEGG